jgi:ABC-type lipoprotein export system ATPase subunit
MIDLQNVSKDYELDTDLAFSALKGVNLLIKQGEFTAIMGPSGSGKSTLMHIIGLLDKPTKGKVLIEDKDVSRLNDNSLSQLRSEFVGFVFQQFNLLNKLTLVENITLPSIYYRKKLKYDINKKAEYLMKKVGIFDKKDSYPNKISGGQQQRTAIARALIMEPKLILADEPTGNVDSKTSEGIMKLLKDLNKKDKMTVVIVTHEPDIAKQAKRIITIRDGQVAKK